MEIYKKGKYIKEHLTFDHHEWSEISKYIRKGGWQVVYYGPNDNPNANREMIIHLEKKIK